VIGFLNSASPDPQARLLDGFRLGLKDGGYVEGRNVAIEYRWADGQFARLPELAADLVRRGVSLIAATGGIVSAHAAKAATSTIPVLFIAGPNPVEDGLVASLNRPGANLTGVSLYTSELMPKRLQLLTELVPRTERIALLVNPTDVANVPETKSIDAATRATGKQMILLKASADSDFEPAFASAVQQGAAALLVSANPFFTDRRAQIVALAARHGLSAYDAAYLELAIQRGLMSYGPSIRGVSPDRPICEPNTQRRQAGGSSRAPAHPVRAIDQCRNSEVAWAQCAAQPVCVRRRSWFTSRCTAHLFIAAPPGRHLQFRCERTIF
jgi:putative ABC transport system substrate-binding protein